jgi:hypothetical protein
VEHRLPIDGTLDLHAFRPADAADGVAGKGIGELRRTVESALRRHPLVLSFRTAGEDGGGWGATLVTLREPGSPGP